MNGKTILVVDDNITNIEIVQAILAKDHHRVRTATSGAEALEICGADPKPDLILLDVSMPELSGFEVCTRLQQEPATRSIPIIFVSGQTDADDESKGLELGAVDYITKPIVPRVLLRRVQTHLKLRDAMIQLENYADFLDHRARKRTKDFSSLNEALSKFVPHSFLRAIGKDDITAVQRGDHVFGEMTIMRYDVRAFTRLAAQMTTREVFDFANALHGRMTPIVREHGGFVQQYQGDAAICVFAADPAAAVRCGVAMQHRLTSYNRERESKGRETLRMGIGLHSGPLMLGVLGDDERWESGVPSETVNTTTHVEAATKHFGVGLVISGATAHQIDLSTHRVRFLSEVQVQGKQAALRLYEVYDADPPDLADTKLRMDPRYEDGRQHFASGDYASAVKCFTDVLMALPHDLATRQYLKIAAQYLLERRGPPEGPLQMPR